MREGCGPTLEQLDKLIQSTTNRDHLRFLNFLWWKRWFKENPSGQEMPGS